MSVFWSCLIGLITIGSLLGFFVLLQANNKVDGNESETTGHVYDGIEEYNNPLPRWWYWLFVGSIVYALGYIIYYGGLGSFASTSGWSSTDQYELEMLDNKNTYDAIYAQYRDMTLAEVTQQPKALRMGQRLFSTNCAICHGSAGTGSFGFPNLTDADWLYGGTDQQIEASIKLGRSGTMPAWGSVLGEQGIGQLSAYLLSLNNRAEAPAASQIEIGKEKFQSYCSACHGVDATGNTSMGAPNLSNDIWLYGGSRDRISYTIRKGRNGRMPAHQQLLGDDKVHIVAAYVYSLSHGRP